MPRASKPKFQIYRAKDAPFLEDADCVTQEPVGPVAEPYFKKMFEAGLGDGAEIRLLVNIPGFSLIHVWFKANLPLPPHSHDADCLYYIVAGSLRMGTQVLGPRDSFFVPAHVPYTYRPGAAGVELLEFRHATHFNAVVRANGPAFWEKALQTVRENHEIWKHAAMPSLNTEMSDA